MSRPSVDPALYPNVARIDLDRLRHNARQLRRHAAPAELLAVVKADAYGHGAVPVARALEADGVSWFAVAQLPEALALREAGLRGRLLVFTAPPPDVLRVYRQAELDLTVASAESVAALHAVGEGERPLRVHLKVDTGMGRLGCAPDEAPGLLDRLRAMPGVEVAGVWTHFATADEPEDAFVAEQRAALAPVREAAGRLGVPVHTANSGALAFHGGGGVREAFVRAGIALYGCPDPVLANRLGVRPVMTFTSRVIHLKTVPPGATLSYGRRWRAERPTRVATVAAGYADGYARALTNRAEVGIRGRRYPVAGTVCMDMFMVDLGSPDAPEAAAVALGDEVVLFGDGGPSAHEVATWAGTISYEVCTRVSARVWRRYSGAGAPMQGV